MMKVWGVWELNGDPWLFIINGGWSGDEVNAF